MLLGIVRSGHIMLNPIEPLVITHHDKRIVISHDKINLELGAI